MQRYCLGFSFDGLGRVVLIRKNRPDWQAGKLNGIGGHVEPGETVRASMVREFKEETGLASTGPEWSLFAIMAGKDWVVDVFRRDAGLLWQARTMTDETVMVVPAFPLPADVLSNLNWLIPLALDVGEHNSPPSPVLVNYH